MTNFIIISLDHPSLEIQVILLHTSGARKKRNARQTDFTFWDCIQTFLVIFLLFLLDSFTLEGNFWNYAFLPPPRRFILPKLYCWRIGTWITKLVLATWIFPPAKNSGPNTKHTSFGRMRNTSLFEKFVQPRSEENSSNSRSSQTAKRSKLKGNVWFWWKHVSYFT